MFGRRLNLLRRLTMHPLQVPHYSFHSFSLPLPVALLVDFIVLFPQELLANSSNVKRMPNSLAMDLC